ncbi:MAG: nucleoside triphosphate pyrophosphohydrolase family protein [Alphaproteobacteria bacterium]|nr:nucleoside triphosphate pyrophosphohydrolase family protein [Alphaproteobacteria bacterium]
MKVEEYFINYCNYVDSVTSKTSRQDSLFTERMQELSKLLNGNFARFDNAVTGLAGEAGEVADVWKKIKFMGMEYNDEARDKLVKELGDVCWYLMSAATALGVPLEEIINQNIEKLKSRHPHGFSSAYMQHKKGA